MKKEFEKCIERSYPFLKKLSQHDFTKDLFEGKLSSQLTKGQLVKEVENNDTLKAMQKDEKSQNDHINIIGININPFHKSIAELEKQYEEIVACGKEMNEMIEKNELIRQKRKNSQKEDQKLLDQ